MDVDQSLDALIKAAPKTTKKKAAAATKKAAAKKKNGKVKEAAAAKKKPALKKIAAIKTGRNSIRKSAIGGRSKAMGGGRAVGMAIDQVVRGTGGRRATNSARVTPNKATNDAPTKLLVSNLDFNVTEKDIKDLFSTVARLKKSSLNYGPNGKSKGSGEVIFYNRADALAAMREYSGMKLDGRELQLEIIAASNVGLAPLPIQARLSGRGASKVPQRVPLGRGSRAGPPMGNTGGRARGTGGRNTGGGRGGRGTGGRGRGGPQKMDVQQPKKQTAAKKKAKKPRKPKAKAAPKQPLTAEALDAGLDAYKAQAMES